MSNLISIVTPCYNEVENIGELVKQIRREMSALKYDYEHIVIDNCSTDGTADKLREIAENDTSVKVVFNRRNFGQIRSPYYGNLLASGDAIIHLPSDLEVPINIIPQLLKEWEDGANIVFAVQEKRVRGITSILKTMYMKTLRKISKLDLIVNTSGYGLIDKKTLDSLKEFKTAIPYYRGLLSEIGGITRIVKYDLNPRKKGKSKNNWSELYDYGMIGLVSHTRFPLKVITIVGFVLAVLSALAGLGYLIAKICYWDSFETGMAPAVIGVLFLSSLNLCFLGLLGEYIYQIYLNSRQAPMVFENERLNF